MNMNEHAAALSTLLRGGKKAVCVGKNFHEHITELAELGPQWLPEQEPEPVLFFKPTTSYAWPGEPLVLPRPRATTLNVERNHGVQHELDLARAARRTSHQSQREPHTQTCSSPRVAVRVQPRG